MRYLRRVFLVSLCLFVAPSAFAAVIWSGPNITVTQADFAGLSVTDVLVPGVASLSRDSAGLLCNIAAGDTCGPDMFSNPSDFEWAFSGLNGNGAITYGSAASFAGLTFDILDIAWEGQAGISAPGAVGVGHIISADIYFDIEFFSWSCCGLGGFSYQRSTVNVPEPSTLALLGLGLFGMGFVRRRKA